MLEVMWHEESWKLYIYFLFIYPYESQMSIECETTPIDSKPVLFSKLFGHFVRYYVNNRLMFKCV